MRSTAFCVATGTILLAAVIAAAQDRPEIVLKGHAETVYGIAFSPDGKLVATASFDKSVKLWVSATGKEVKTFGGTPAAHQNLVLSVAFSPDGSMLASAGNDNSVKLWDVPVAHHLREFVHGDSVHAVALSPDGKLLASAGKDGAVKIWSIADGKPVHNLTGHAGAVRSVTFSGKGELLASGGADGTVRFWDPAKGQPGAKLTAHAGPVNAVLLVPAGTLAATAGDDGTVKLWQMPVPTDRLLPPQADAITALALSADGAQVFSAGADKLVRQLTIDKGKPVRQFEGAAAALTSVAVAGNGSLLAAGTADQKLLLWNVADGKLLSADPAHDGAVTSVSVHPQATQLLTGGADGKIKIWMLPAPLKSVVEFEAHPGGVGSVQFHGNGTQAVSGGADKIVKHWDLATGKPIRTFGPLEGGVTAVSFNRDFTQIAAAAGQTVKLWNTADGKDLATLVHPADVLSLSFSADKGKLVTGSADHLTRVWDIASGKLLQGFTNGGAVRGVAFLPDNRTVIAGSADKSLTLHTLAVTRLFALSSGPVHGLALTPQGTHVLAAADKSVKVCNIGTGAVERSIDGGKGLVQSVAMSGNGLLVAIGGDDSMVRIHTLADGKLLKELPAPGSVRSLTFSSNNLILAASCDKQAVAAWNVAFTGKPPIPPDFGKPLQGHGTGQAASNIAIGLDNATIYTAGADKSVKVWKLASNDPVKNLVHPNRVDCVAFDQTGQVLASGAGDGNLRFWDVAKGAILKQVPAHIQPQPAPIYTVVWTPDGKHVVTSSYDRSLKLWTAPAGSLVREFKAYKEKDFEKGHREAVFAAAISPDGKVLASGGGDRSIKLWNIADGSVLQELVNPQLKANQPGPDGKTLQPPESHPGWVYALRFTADGRHLVSVGHAPKNQGYLAVWSIPDGKLVHAATLPQGPCNHVALSGDGKQLAIACSPPTRQYTEVASYIMKMPIGP